MCFPGHILNDLFTVFLLPFLKNLIKSVMKKKNFTFLFKLCKKVEEECIEKRRKQKLFSGGWGGGGRNIFLFGCRCTQSWFRWNWLTAFDNINRRTVYEPFLISNINRKPQMHHLINCNLCPWRHDLAKFHSLSRFSTSFASGNFAICIFYSGNYNRKLCDL